VPDSPPWPPARRGTWVIDLDGVVWLTGAPIDGAADAVARLRAAGIRPLFATNNSAPTIAELLARLERCAIPAGADDLVTSAQAAASMVAVGTRVLALASGGVEEALQARGVHLVKGPPVDAVVVGWTDDIDFSRLAAAASAARDGARLIGTNDDPTLPTPDGLLPGAGALLAAVAVAAGVTPELAGKPHEAMVRLITERAGDVVAAVGDRPSTDGALAAQLGVPFALVVSEVSHADGARRPAGPAPSVVAADLGRLVTGALPS
jgi:glycerol 3-phosphatase-2